MSVALILWVLNLLADTGGQLAFKRAATDDTSREGLDHWKHMASQPWIWLGVLCYIVEFFVWTGFISEVELSVAVMLGSFNIVAIVVGGHLLFKERFTPWRVLGVSLITAGVMLVGLGQ